MPALASDIISGQLLKLPLAANIQYIMVAISAGKRYNVLHNHVGPWGPVIWLQIPSLVIWDKITNLSKF